MSTVDRVSISRPYTESCMNFINYIINTFNSMISVDGVLLNHRQSAVDEVLMNYLLSAVDCVFMNYLLYQQYSVDGGIDELPVISSRWGSR